MLTQDLKNLVGNIWLASASVDYVAPFTSELIIDNKFKLINGSRT